MAEIGPFRAGIAVRHCDRGQIVTARVACRHHVRVLEERSEISGSAERRHQYKLNVLNVLRVAAQSVMAELGKTDLDDTAIEGHDTIRADVEAAEQLVQKFVDLAETLGTSKAVAMCFTDDEDTKHDALAQAWSDAFEDADGDACTLLTHRMELLECPSVRAGLLHPLSVALLAYRMGGPVNAANTAYAHTWKLPEPSATPKQSFHMEGDCGDLFDDYRITLVWETNDGKAKGVSGNHHVFLTEDATPRPLATLDAAKRADVPMSIIYDSMRAALCYDCPSPGAVRNSITLDFHLNTLADDELRLLSASDVADLKEITLSKLITGFPILGYSTHFHSLLFNAESFNMIFTKLSTLVLSKPERPEVASDVSKRLLEQRFEAYKRDNLAHIPPAIKSMETDFAMCGTYSTPASFLASVCIKARRDIHLPIGMGLFPQSPLDENLESARKLIRDLPGEFVSTRLAQYPMALLRTPFTLHDLFQTSHLYSVAKSLERRCLELIGTGFVDNASNLPSVAALTSAIGSALHGPKEIQITAEPWVDDSDLQIFRTRCLYLFWCADWLVCYLGKPEEGPFMVIDVETAREDLKKVRAEIGRMAQLLLRNWVAWGMFVEGLPKGGFFVRRLAH